MRRIAVTLILGAAILGGTALPAAAQRPRMWFGDTPPTADLSASQRAFVRTYVAAIANRDVRHRRRVVHPASLACQRKENEDFFRELFAKHRGIVTHEPPVTVESLPPHLSLFETFAKYGYRYPVRPTHAFYFELVPTGPNERTALAFSVMHHGSWYEVLPCPTPEGLARYRARRARQPEPLPR